VEHSPPPFFKRGPAPLVRLFFFASLSLALLVLDARFQYGQGVRALLSLVAYPLQVIATAPIDLVQGVTGYFSNQSQLIEDNEQLRAKALAYSRDAQRYQSAEAEAAQLRRLIGATERLGVRTLPAEVLYAGRDPYSHKVFIDRGATHGVRPGSPVAGPGRSTTPGSWSAPAVTTPSPGRAPTACVPTRTSAPSTIAANAPLG